MDSSVQLVFSDMDGTFLASDKSIADINWKALDVLAEGGIGFVPCTGRAWRTLSRRLIGHPSVRYLIETNGASIIDARDGRHVLSVPMSKKSVLDLYGRVRNADCTFDVFSNGKVLCARRRFGRVSDFGIDAGNLRWLIESRYQLEFATPQIITDCNIIDKVTMFFSMSFDRSVATKAVEADSALTWTIGHPQNIEVSNVRATKGNAIRWLCAYLGVSPSRAVAFGDSANDVTMLEACGEGVAMPNGSTDAKGAASRLAHLDNDHGGVGDYIFRSL